MEGNRSAHFDSSGQGAKFDPFILNNKRRLLRSILFQSAQPIEAYDIVVLPPPLGRPVLPRATSGSAARSAAVDRRQPAHRLAPDLRPRGRDDSAVHHRPCRVSATGGPCMRSEEHTSELQSIMRSSYAGFCLKKKNRK